MARLEMNCIFKFSLKFSFKYSYPFLRQNQKNCTMDYTKKLIDAFVLNSKVTYLAQVKVRIKPFPTKSVKCTCTQAGLATRKEWRRFSFPHFACPPSQICTVLLTLSQNKRPLRVWHKDKNIAT